MRRCWATGTRELIQAVPQTSQSWSAARIRWCWYSEITRQATVGKLAEFLNDTRLSNPVICGEKDIDSLAGIRIVAIVSDDVEIRLIHFDADLFAVSGYPESSLVALIFRKYPPDS